MTSFTDKHLEVYYIIDPIEVSNGMLLNINIFKVGITVKTFSFPCLFTFKILILKVTFDI